ncbi:hypothetical protein LTR37_006811 [Vermiconidia calcicola]|uniref:Uncharacterized protein n=1 Tax=Vermiconidia calcicola TaxID=1690605 RepID=A0ACC3NFI3_9PEZI|nr:hypothetical protein LTR37_006811 [Vermiconidia calcicola]
MAGAEKQQIASAYSTNNEDFTFERTSRPSNRYEAFRRLPFPEGAEKQDPAAWATLLEAGLPPHLRIRPESATYVISGVEDIAEILLAAQRLVQPKNGIDLLCYLGVEKGRWSAVVWLVKRMVEAFGADRLRQWRLAQTICSWSSDHSLDTITGERILVEDLAGSGPKLHLASPVQSTLDELTDDLKPDNLSRRELLQHDALGQIWRSLGHMTIACANEDMKPEILEIIAYLHHMEIMPSSIYNQKPSTEAMVIQQPPTLNLFSSRILTSLSDAAWRAHAKLVVEEAKAKGGEYASLRPEIPGTAYRVNVAGLRPEIWLELILWSCLHGGWILQGTELLRMMYTERGHQLWRPQSWRSTVAEAGSEDPDWDKLVFSFNTRKPSTMDYPKLKSPVSIERTISSEAVNAYIDALLSSTRLGVGERGLSPGYVLKQLRMLQNFLSRADLALGAGSWDAVVLRYFDSHQESIDQVSGFEELAKLSPAMGQELNVAANRDLPPYILDGSAAVLGLSHEAIRSRIRHGDAQGALRLFKLLFSRADENKRRSLADFLEKQAQSSRKDATAGSQMFTSHFSGIDYPAFDTQVPSSVLGPLMELVADSGAYDFGKWLLYSNEIDGPVIPERLYSDPIVAPALFRFAAETVDKVLLTKLIRARALPTEHGSPDLRKNVLLTMFDSQVKRGRWDAAVRILENVQLTPYAYWNIINLAHVARAALIESGGATSVDQSSQNDLPRAKDLFSDMVQGKYERLGERPKDAREQITSLLITLAAVDESWAAFCVPLLPRERKSHHSFLLPAKAFNIMLEGVAEVYSASTARRVLRAVWPHAIRRARRSGEGSVGSEATEPRMPRFERSSLENPDRFRNVIELSSQPPHTVVVYGGFKPNMMTILLIFRRALEEFKTAGSPKASSTIEPLAAHLPASPITKSVADNDAEDELADDSLSGLVVWAARHLRILRRTDNEILTELQRSLSEDELESIREQLPRLVGQADEAEEDSIADSEDDTSNTNANVGL